MSAGAPISASPSHRVLVTGAAGVMGARLVQGLLERGFVVRCLVLPNDPGRGGLEALGCELREGDISDASSLAGLCADVATVYHLAAIILSHDPSVFARVNRDGTLHLLNEARAAGVRHFIYVSSASVTYPRRTPYAESKWQAERMVASESSFQTTIVRPTLVYDRSGGQEFLIFERHLRRFPIVPFIGRGNALKRPVWAGDIVNGLLRLAENPVSYGKLYNFSGAESISIRELAHLILARRGADRPFLHVPVFVFRALAFLLERSMKRPPLTASAIAGIVNDADLDPELAMRELGYQPLGVYAGFEHCFPKVTSASPLAGALSRGSSS